MNFLAPIICGIAFIFVIALSLRWPSEEKREVLPKEPTVFIASPGDKIGRPQPRFSILRYEVDALPARTRENRELPEHSPDTNYEVLANLHLRALAGPVVSSVQGTTVAAMMPGSLVRLSPSEQKGDLS